MSGFLVRWQHPQHVYQRGDERFAQESPAVWQTYTLRARGSQATCYEAADDGTETILPIITWTDRIDMAVHRMGVHRMGVHRMGVHRAQNTPVSMIRVIEGGAGAVDVACYCAEADDPWGKKLGLYKPDWRAKRWVTGRITTDGVVSPAAEMVSRLIAHGDWQPMSWRAWAASGVQQRDESVRDPFAVTQFGQQSIAMFAEALS